MAMTEVDRAAFHRRMAEYDQTHGIERAAAAPLHPAGEPDPRDDLGIERAARHEWEQSPSIRLEFEQFERYAAFCRADAKGLVRILSRSRQA